VTPLIVPNDIDRYVDTSFSYYSPTKLSNGSRSISFMDDKV
jgi:hypothetical protein